MKSYSVARNATKRSKIAEKVNIISVKDISNRRPTSGAELVGLSPGIRIQSHKEEVEAPSLEDLKQIVCFWLLMGLD